jgi:hypothetical protein
MNYIEQINEIQKLQDLRKQDKETYYEKHHILPKFMGGKDEDGLILVTIYEHVLLHYLLAIENKENKYYYIGNISAAHFIFNGKSKNLNKKVLAIKKFLKSKKNQKLIEIIKIENAKKGFFILSRNNEKYQKIWIQHNFQKPFLKTKFYSLKENEIILDKCPICQQPNSETSFACCKEHEIEYLVLLHYKLLEQLKNNYQQKSELEKQQINYKRKISFTGKKHKQETKELMSESAKKSWEKGRDFSNYGGTKWMHKGIIQKMIKKELVDEYLQNGWELGQLKQLIQNKKFIHKDNKEKRVTIDMLNQYLEDGWVLGRKTFSKEVKEKMSKSAKQRMINSEKIRDKNTGMFLKT